MVHVGHDASPILRARSGIPGPDDPLWYKDAILYELHVKAFFDSNDDGIGDFRGLIEKLDYLQDLGVTALWLLPTYPSPLRDDGYDIADYMNVLPAYGSLEDFEAFVEAAHSRGLRVITELVMNHTSDQHPWFQAARDDPSSPFRNHYVWSDTDQKYSEAHSYRISMYATKIAEALGLDTQSAEDVRLAAMLRNVNEMGVTNDILFKAANLSESDVDSLHKDSVRSDSKTRAMSSTLQRAIPIMMMAQQLNKTGATPADANLEVQVLTLAEKFDSLISVITMSELLYEAQKVASATRDNRGLFALAAIIYLLLGLPFARLARWAERRMAVHLRRVET